MKNKILVFLFLMIYSSGGFSQVISDFEGDNTDGWVSEGDGVYYYEATTGNPGGCFRVDDDATGDMNYSFAPLKFLGNWSSATASDTLSADIFLNQIATAYITSNNFLFRIKGPGGQATAILNPNPPYKTWKTYKVSLSPTDWQLNSGTWSGLMQQVTTLIVTMEFISGDEFNRLDNVKLSFSPVAVPVNPVVCSGFEEGNYDGWTFSGSGGVSNQASGGNPGRYVQIANGTGTAFALAPTKFLGDWNALDNHSADIRFDLKVTYTSGSLLLNSAFLQISGPGGVARIPMDSAVQQAFGAWHTFSFPVQSSSWILDSGTWSDLLDQVVQLQLCTEFTSGSETVGFDNFCITNTPPVAGFTASPLFAYVGEPVQFTDQSAQAPISWNWNFGDGYFSGDQNPVHVYNTPELYTVSLQVTNHFGSDTETKTGYLQVYGVEQCQKYADNFTAATIHPTWTLLNGTWAIVSGTMRQSANYYGSTPLLAAWAITGSQQWSDYTVAASLMSTDNDRIGLVFNFQDYQNMYMFMWYLAGGERALYKWVNGVGTVLASDNVGYTTNTWYQVKVGGHNGNIQLEINGQEIFNVWDTTFPSGKAGLYNWANQSSFYDNVIVECAIPDSLYPGNISVAGGETHCFEALEVITIGGTDPFVVQNGGEAKLVAGQKIAMLPGVTVFQGGLFTARISQNGYYCNTPSVGKSSTPDLLSTPSVKSLTANKISIFPNPSTGKITILSPSNLPREMVFIDIYNGTGKMVKRLEIKQAESYSVDLAGYPEGIYLISLRQGGQLFAGKVILN